MQKVLSYILAIILLGGAFGHVAMPEFYAPMIPSFVPSWLAHGYSIVMEAGAGVLLLLPKYRKWGGLAFSILMISFLPIHIWDLFREEPAIGPHPAPVIRVVLQLAFIYAGWWIYRKYLNQE